MYDPIPAISPYFQPGAADPMGVVAQAQGLQNIGSGIFMGRGGSQSYDAMRSGFQRASGDATADIFAGLGDRNIARVYNQNAANYNRAYAGGGVPAPTTSAVTAATAAGRPAAPSVLTPQAQELLPLLQALPPQGGVPRPQAGSIATLQTQNLLAYRMAHPEYDSSNHTSTPAHQAVLRSLGHVPPTDQEAFDTYQTTGRLPKPVPYQTAVETNPVSPQYGLDPMVYNDPKFQSMLHFAPTEAAKTYEALTGVPLAAAQKVLTDRHADREKVDDVMVTKFLNNGLHKDQKTGEWYTLRRVRKPADRLASLGGESHVEYEDVREPLDPIELQWLQTGAFQRKTGMQLDMSSRGSTAPTGDPDMAAIDARINDLQARRGGPVNPEFKTMMTEIGKEYPFGPTAIPRSMFYPGVAEETIKKTAGDVWDIGMGLNRIMTGNTPR